MSVKPGHVNTRPHPFVLAVITVILTLGLLALLPGGRAQAAGHWTTGVLTNNSVDDANPLLSSTHLVWAQKRGDSWDIKLRTIATGVTATIITVPDGSGLAEHIPQLSITDDYITIHPLVRDFWHLYQISTGTTSTYASIGFTLTGVICEDGHHVVQTVDDGDSEIRAFDISREESWPITNNSHADYLGGASHGRIVWESFIPPTHRTILAYDLSTGEPVLVYDGHSGTETGMYPQISENWVAYNDLVAGKLCLYRLADGLTIQADASSNFMWALTDDFAFWTEYRAGSSGPVDLYAFDLNTLQKTRLTSDTGYEQIVEAEGDRVLYMTRATEHAQGDLMVIDLGEEPLERHILGTGITLGGPSGLIGVGGRASMCGDVIVALVDDGHDDEICWAMWVEDADDADDGDDGDSGDDGDGEGDDGDGSVTFSDVAGSPYETAIYDLASRGIILGFEDDTFRPLDKVSRQQFAKMIVKALGLAVTGMETCPFTDVAVQIGTDPFYPSKYVAVCASEGITAGKTSTTFAPYDDITHQQLITMVVRAAALGTPPASYDPGFSSGQFSLDEHYQNARKAAYAGLLNGLQGVGSSYNFIAPSTRGECAQILYNLLHME